MNYRITLLAIASFLSQDVMAQSPQKVRTSQVATYEVQTGDPAPISSPFFADTTPSEIMEKFEELEGRIEALEAQSIHKGDGTIQVMSKGGALIQLNEEDILLKAPGKILIEAKEIKAPGLER
jgi:hypothetical protein